MSEKKPEERDQETKDAEDAIDMMIVKIIISELGPNPSDERVKAFFKKYPRFKKKRKLIVDSFDKVKNLDG